jgi:protein SCO1/2
VLRANVFAVIGIAVIGYAQPYGRPPALQNIGIEQKMNSQVPLDAQFIDEGGKIVRLGDYFRGKPVVLSLVYYRCPMLCNLVLNGELRSFRQLPLEIGKDFDAVTLSFDANETPELAAEKKASYVEKYNRGDASSSWHFLTGKPEQIDAVADSVGFRYKWDETTKQWAHASGIVVLSPDGRASRYLFGIEYPAKDLRLALVEASAGKIGSPSDKILLFCYHYDPSKGKYTFAVMNALRAGGSATALALGLFLFVSLRRERKAGVRGVL